MKTKRMNVAIAAVVGLTIGATSAMAAETKGPVTDEIGVVKIRKGAPIFIGGYWTLSGPDTPPIKIGAAFVPAKNQRLTRKAWVTKRRWRKT